MTEPKLTARIRKSVMTALPKGLKTAWWLIKITVPVSLAVMLLDHYGILSLVAGYTSPLFSRLGLPGASAVVFITSIFTNIYSVVAILAMLDFPLREGTILAVMCLISHGFLIESAVMKRTGSSVARMVLVRLTGSFLAAWLLNLVMPGNMSDVPLLVSGTDIGLTAALLHWLNSITSTVLKILVLVNLLLIAQQLMEEFGWIAAINKPLTPVMKVFGLPHSATLSWVVANLIGLAYGSAIMIDQREKGRMSRSDADLLNHHVAVSHSQLEDPLLFITLGYTLHWLIWPRMLVALLAVWLRKLELRWSRQRARLPEPV
ncbi:nucleoside recognition domain-containing protein [Lentimicrobium sp.]|uniref:nucleoside recognition domain-containing protein n=1 Tax=Lentimicrobium sp. TaxID=2034841 RepID=UPI002C3F1207|nr:nucleoside recognition domain-containing protein [Lentimicrobium sp.]HPJ61947.1 nucleoside recognition domain-containing protein [Lentimicrobium sp.]